MKTVSKHLVTFAGLLALQSSLPLATAQDQIFCDPNARPVFCTPVYSPVCAYTFGCDNSLCSYTAINACAACGQSDINYYTLGECFYNSRDVDEYLSEESGNNAGEAEGNEGHEGSGHESPEEGHAPETELETVFPEEGQTPETEISPEEGIVPETEISPEEGNVPETEISPEEGNVPETEEQLGEQETEEEIEIEQPTQPVEEEVTEEDTTESSENEEAPGGNPDTSNCPTSGVLVYVNGKFIRGTYCCGAQSSCDNKVSPVCGSLNQCVGSICRQTAINSCNACQDSNVKLYFPGTCHQLFGDAEVTLEANNDDSESTELTEDGNVGGGGADDDFDFRMLQLDDDWFDIQLS